MTIQALYNLIKKIPPNKRKSKIKVFGDINEEGEGQIKIGEKIYQVN